MRWLRCAGWFAGLSCVSAACGGAAVLRAGDTTGAAKIRAQKKVVALSPWEQAERGREALKEAPEAGRTKADYARAMDLYRAIYHADPRDGHAPAAVEAVAELLAEQGRGLHDAKASQAAVGQYEFLRKQYPGSSLGVQALLAEGQIEQNDLGDAAAARERYALLLKEHPKSELAEEARAAIASLVEGLGTRVVAAGDSGRQPSHPGESAMDGPQGVVVGSPNGSPSSLSKQNVPQGLKPPADSPGDGTAEAVPLTRQPGRVSALATQQDNVSVLPAMAQTTLPYRGEAAMRGKILKTPGAQSGVEPQVVSGKKAVVSGIRHWSTPTYTRVAIDLGDEVTYEAARVPNPDRIYFDLHGTRLAQELVGKSFAVTDDGFLKKIRAAQFSDEMTRVVLDVSDVSEYSAFLLPNPYRLIIDIHGGQAGPVATTIGAPQRRAEAAPAVPNTTAVKQTSSAEVAAVSAMPGKVEATTKPTSKPISAVVEGHGSGTREEGSRLAKTLDPTHRDEAAMNGAPSPVVASKNTHRDEAAMSGGPSPVVGSKKTTNTAVAEAAPARAAVPTADGETSLVRTLGLKIGRIVIDAGHGGHDSGTLGVDGIEEKDVVLDVALRVGKLLHDRLGAEIIYTRSDDTFIPLETRTAIANKAQADLFLSIHANSSSDASARGVETYYLNFTSDPSALETAARENAVSDQSIHQLSDLVKKIALKDKIAESREFAADVEGSLYTGLQKGNEGLKNRGVKKAPFVVLIGANMPSILAEISFVTNPKDAGQMREPEYRQRMAESLYKGVVRYEGGLSGTGRGDRAPVERAAGQ